MSQKTYVDEYSRIRAVWDVVKSYTVTAKGWDNTPQRIATFYNYQDVYVFMAGIAAVAGNKGVGNHSKIEVNNTLFEIKSSDIYLGKDRAN